MGKNIHRYIFLNKNLVVYNLLYMNFDLGSFLNSENVTCIVLVQLVVETFNKIWTGSLIADFLSYCRRKGLFIYAWCFLIY